MIKICILKHLANPFIKLQANLREYSIV